METRQRDAGPAGDIAVVGVGCRLPGGVTDLDGLWDLLRHGVDTTGAVPPERWGAEFHSPDPDAPGTSYCPRGAFLADVETFDADFFGISPLEAGEIDPQQRLLLETAWAAMEDSGRPREKWAGSRTGVYAGILAMDYTLLHAKTAGIGSINPYYASGKEFSFAAGRIGYVFGLHGPSMMVNAACSSSLIAVHLACQALRAGECDTALAGGVNLLLAPELSVFMSKVRALSPSGSCRPFDTTADGVVRGEGAAMVVLKRTADAIADGDRILGVIAGSATNHDGRSAGLTAPNPEAQQAVLAHALRAAKLEPRDLSYVEAHATGTPLGDPIEVAALASVLGAGRDPDDPLPIGSIKANFGHLDSAAGILGLLKAMLIVRHRVVPPQIHLDRPIDDLRASGLTVATAATPLAGTDGPVYAGVSAFGLSGSNAHLILASPPALGAGVPRRPAARKGRPAAAMPLLLLSAPDHVRLRRHAAELGAALAAPDAPDGADLFATAAVRRTHFAGRLAVRAGDIAQARAALDAYAHGAEHPALRAGDTADARPLPFVHAFTGAAAHPRLGLGLYRTQPVFRAALDACAAVIEAEAGWSLLTELGRSNAASSREPAVNLPVLVAVQLALSRLWESWGLPPVAVLGHGPGRIAAAAAAGVLDTADAMRLALRAAARPAADAADRLVVAEGTVDDVTAAVAPIAGVRVLDVLGPATVVLAGPGSAIRQAAATLRGAGITCGPARPLTAFDLHPGSAETAALAAGLTVRPPRVPLLALPADYVNDADRIGQLVGPDRLWPAVDEFLGRRAVHFLELGPGPVLSSQLTAALRHRKRTGRVYAALNHAPDAVAAVADTLAALYVTGAPVEWDRVFTPPRRPVPLPATELAGRRFWLAGVTAGAQGGAPAAAQSGPAAGPPITTTPRATQPEPAATAVPAAAGARIPAPRAPLPDGTPTAGPAPGGAAVTVSAQVAEVRPVSREDVAVEITRMAATLLGHDPDKRLSRAQGFFDLGMDSFTLGRLARAISERWACDVGPGELLDHPSIDQTAELVVTLAPAEPAPQPSAPAAPVASPQAGHGTQTAGTPAGPTAPATAPTSSLTTTSPEAVPADPVAAAVAPGVGPAGPAAPAAPAAGQGVPGAGAAGAPPEDGAAAGAPPADGVGADEDAIAIIGIGARFPGGDEGPDGYWRMLRDGVDASGEVPADRWPAAQLLSADQAPGTVATARGSFLDRVDTFDHQFFRVSAREARSMDPQQRIFLEVAWEALDDAAVDPRGDAAGRAGVFAGLNTTDYQQLVTRHTSNVDLYYGTGNSFSGTSGRLSYFLGLRGPSLSVDTACSASLTAVHLACQSIRSGECDLAVAGGSNIMATPTVYLAMSAGGALSADGRCKTFDAAADGYGRGEGAGAVVLKRLSSAIADGDRVYAVIRGSAVNHNGASGGLTVPSTDAQTEVIRTALARGGIAPAAVGYVEAHGTGTRLGDGIELRALAAAYGTGRDPARPLLVGSAKTNIGHLEAAAGIAGLIKTVLALRHAEIPPHLHFTDPSTQVAWDRLPLRVSAAGAAWPPGPEPRLAGVSAFGFTGTNAHVVISEAPAATPVETPATGRYYVLPVSGAGEPVLAEALDRLRHHVSGLDEAGLRDAAHTAFRRAHHEHRRAVVGRTAAELAEALAAPRHAGVVPAGTQPRTAFVFGATLPDLDWNALADREPVFAAALDECAAEIAAQLGTDLRERLRGGFTGDRVAALAVQVALARLWQAQGLHPDVHVGRGVGEVAAAVCGGALDLAEGVRVAAGRGTPTARGTGTVLFDSTSATARTGDPLAPWYGSDAWAHATASALARSGPVLAVAVTGGPAASELAGLAPQQVTAIGGDPVPRSFADAVAQLFVHGARLDPDRVTPRGRVVSLPRYPWQRRRHWIDVPVLLADDPKVAGHGGPHPHLAPAFVPADQPDVRYHAVRGPLAATDSPTSPIDLAEAALGAARDALGTAPLSLTGLGGADLSGALATGGRGPQLRLCRDGDGLAVTLHPADGGLPAARLQAHPAAAPAVPATPGSVRPAGGLLLAPDAVAALLAAAAEALGGHPVELSTLDGVDWWAAAPDRISARAAVGPDGAVDATAYAPDGTVLFALRGMRFVRTDTFLVTPEEAERWTGAGYRTRWERAEVSPAAPSGTWAVRPASPAAEELAVAVAAALAERGAELTEGRADRVVMVADGAEPAPEATAALVAAARDAVATGAWLSIVTCGATDAPGVTPRPGPAAAAATARVVATEIGTAWGLLVDVPAGVSGAAHAALALTAGPELPEDELVHTQSGWYAPRLEHHGPLRGPLPPPRLDPERWYVVTDALDPRNETFLDWLRAHGMRRLAVVTATSDRAPSRGRGAAAGSTTAASRPVAERLAGQGVEVRVIPPGDLAGALAGLDVGGVVHLAQPAPLRSLAEFDPAEAGADLSRYRIAAQLDAATRGTGAAGAATTPMFVVTGSAAAHFGAVGAAGRAAAEGALLSLVAARRAAGLPAQLLRWMPRADTGDLSVRDAAGMAVSGVTPADAGDLREAFDLLLRSGVAHLDRAVIAEAAFVRAYGPAARRSVAAALAADGAPAATAAAPRAAEVLALDADQRLDRVLETVCAAVADALGETDVAPDVGFFELGMDSVMSMALRTTVERAFGCSLTPTLTFEYPTSRALSAHVLEQIGGAPGGPRPGPAAAVPAPAGTAPPPAPAATAPDGLDEASDDDLMTRLALALSGARRLLDEKGQ
ncbi:beta-ketoacyl synthase N-terminal-like domain-containing protein [Catellatospora sp. NPDC049609]|uniref:beta-ketoacyl synthase N-terminal-like domain-containing protein n=1 Tax=Catellatospora sp. NPDC049609 TaxID=3155505 RepID=UPI003418485D